MTAAPVGAWICKGNFSGSVSVIIPNVAAPGARSSRGNQVDPLDGFWSHGCVIFLTARSVKA